MASLSGTQIKNTYTGLLKTELNTAISASDQVVTDGAGGTTGLSLSSSSVKAASLKITSVSQNQSRTKFLNWDATDGVIGFYDFTDTDPEVTVSSTATSATVTIGTNALNDFTIADGTNTTVNLSGTTITIDAELTRAYFGEEINPTQPGTNYSKSISSDDSGKMFTLSNINQEVGQVLLPAAEVGLRYKFVVTSDNKGTFDIDTNGTDVYGGGILLTNSATDRTGASSISIPYSMLSEAGTNKNRIRLTANTSTSGNKAGTWVELHCYTASRWVVTGNAYCDETYSYFAPSGNAVPGSPSTTDFPAIFTTK